MWCNRSSRIFCNSDSRSVLILFGQEKLYSITSNFRGDTRLYFLPLPLPAWSLRNPGGTLPPSQPSLSPLSQPGGRWSGPRPEFLPLPLPELDLPRCSESFSSCSEELRSEGGREELKSSEPSFSKASNIICQALSSSLLNVDVDGNSVITGFVSSSPVFSRVNVGLSPSALPKFVCAVRTNDIMQIEKIIILSFILSPPKARVSTAYRIFSMKLPVY